MKRICTCLLLSLSLLLTGCGAKQLEAGFGDFSSALGRAQNLGFTARLRAEYENKSAKFTLRYEEDAEGGTVTVVAPELIAGIKAHVSPGGTQLSYDSVVLDTGSLDSFGLSPMTGMPLLSKALKTGHPEAFWQEDGLSAVTLRISDEHCCSVWFEGNYLRPVRAEIFGSERVSIFMEIEDWSFS